MQLKQGLGVWGVETKIADADGTELRWYDVAFGDVSIRGQWICRAYLRRGAEAATDADGWSATGDVGAVDPNDYLGQVDRQAANGSPPSPLRTWRCPARTLPRLQPSPGATRSGRSAVFAGRPGVRLPLRAGRMLAPF